MKRVAVFGVGVAALFVGVGVWYVRPILVVHRIGLTWEATLRQSDCARVGDETFCTTDRPLARGQLRLDPPTYTATIQYAPVMREVRRAERRWYFTDSVAWASVVDSTRRALGAHGWEQLPCDMAVTHFAVADAWRVGAREIRFYATPRMPVPLAGDRYFATVHLVAFGAGGCGPRYGVRLLTPSEMAEAVRMWVAKQIGF
jgi:hypothetical protein